MKPARRAVCRNCKHLRAFHRDYLIKGSMLCWVWGWHGCNCPGYKPTKKEAK